MSPRAHKIASKIKKDIVIHQRWKCSDLIKINNFANFRGGHKIRGDPSVRPILYKAWTYSVLSLQRLINKKPADWCSRAKRCDFVTS